jgi:hypothetical protein
MTRVAEEFGISDGRDGAFSPQPNSINHLRPDSSERRSIMLMVVVTLIGFVGAMGLPAFATALVESAASNSRKLAVARPHARLFEGRSRLIPNRAEQ